MIISSWGHDSASILPFDLIVAFSLCRSQHQNCRFRFQLQIMLSSHWKLMIIRVIVLSILTFYLWILLHCFTSLSKELMAFSKAHICSQSQEVEHWKMGWCLGAQLLGKECKLSAFFFPIFPLQFWKEPLPEVKTEIFCFWGRKDLDTILQGQLRLFL